MKPITILLTTMGISLLTSCGMTKNVNRKIMRIEEGMTKAEVLQIMGKDPDRRVLLNGIDKWKFYENTNIFGTDWKSITVLFQDGKVIGVSTDE